VPVVVVVVVVCLSECVKFVKNVER
jgi:hypothetical protein